MAEDYYKILEIDKKADAETIKKAYRKKAMATHPDKGGDENDFKKAAEAYEILSDPEKRKRYDQFGHGSSSVSGRGGGSGAMNMEDIFSRFGDIFGGGGNPFEAFFTGGKNRPGVRRGSNLRIKVKLTLEEIATGVEKKVKVAKNIACDKCEGNGAEKGTGFSSCSTCKGTGKITRTQQTILGYIQTSSLCPTCEGQGNVITEKCTGCNGNGIVRGEEIISISIPPGVTEGMQLSVSGKGNAERNGIAGDLIIVIEELEHSHFKREGNDIYYEHLVSFSDSPRSSIVLFSSEDKFCGVHTLTLISKSPFPYPFTSGIPFPFRRNTLPD